MTKPEMKDIPLGEIRIDGGTQMRDRTSPETVEEYKLAHESGANFPPADVFFDGEAYWMADGIHRYLSANAAKVPTLDCRVHLGTKRDAIIFAAGANDVHGLKRTTADKRKAVTTLLRDQEWGKWSSREIGEKCHVSHSFVGDVRASLDANPVTNDPAERKFTSKHGTEATMKTDGINKTRSKKKEEKAETGNPISNDVPPTVPDEPAKKDDLLEKLANTSAVIRPAPPESVAIDSILGQMRKMIDKFPLLVAELYEAISQKDKSNRLFATHRKFLEDKVSDMMSVYPSDELLVLFIKVAERWEKDKKAVDQQDEPARAVTSLKK